MVSLYQTELSYQCTLKYDIILTYGKGINHPLVLIVRAGIAPNLLGIITAVYVFWVSFGITK